MERLFRQGDVIMLMDGENSGFITQLQHGVVILHLPTSSAEYCRFLSFVAKQRSRQEGMWDGNRVDNIPKNSIRTPMKFHGFSKLLKVPLC